jgi:single-stranded-DNA-specific exonuclease
MKWVPFDTPLEEHPKFNRIKYLAWESILDPILTHYLYVHGFDTEEKLARFQFPNLISDLHNPILLNDMKKATVRIMKAIKRKEKILIFGDY